MIIQEDVMGSILDHCEKVISSILGKHEVKMYAGEKSKRTVEYNGRCLTREEFLDMPTFLRQGKLIQIH